MALPRFDPGERLDRLAARATVGEAHRWIDACCRPLPTESVAVPASLGRILAEPLAAPGDFPPGDRATVDGFALRAEESVGAGSYDGTALRPVSLAGSLAPGQTAAISLGAPLPAGADAVAPSESVRRTAGRIEIVAAVPPGQGVERAGDDIRAGQTMLPPGRLLRPLDLAWLLAAGVVSVPVVRRCRVRLLAMSGSLPPTDCDLPMLQALIERDGGVVVDQSRPADEADAVRKLLAAGPDVVIGYGGTGQGLDDMAVTCLAANGEIAFHGVALRPGGTSAAGSCGGVPVFLLPGHPVACLCAYDMLVGRAIRRLAGLAAGLPYPVVEATAGRKFNSEIGSTDLYRVRLRHGRAWPLASGASIGFSTAAQADGFVAIPPEDEGIAEGAALHVHVYPPAVRCDDSA